MAGQLRVAAIGCGYWGKNIARTLSSLGVLSAVIDQNDALAEQMSAEFGGVPMSMDRLLADDTITAVTIATPAATHFQVARDCLEAGKHVFVEKPMSLAPAHARELIDLAKQRNLTLMVGHLLQYHPVFVELMRIISAGELGDLRYAYSNRLNLGKIRREEDILWSFAPHDLSMLLRIAGESPNHITTIGTFALSERIADVTTTHLEFPSGLRGHVFVSWLHPVKEQKLVVVGDKAMAVFDDRAAWSQKLALFEGGVTWVDGLPVATPVKPQYVEVAESEPLTNELAHFVECVLTGATPLTDGHEGLEVLNVLATATDQLLQDASRSNPGHPEAQIHESAIVDEGVSIGAGTSVYHFSHIITGSRIGSNCSLGQNVMVGPNVTIGDGCKIQNNVSVYDGVTLEDGVFCGPSMVFTNVLTPRAFVSRKSEFAPTLVRKGASIGANATVVCGTQIGRYSLIGAGAVVTRDVPDHALMLGIPARQVGWVSEEGEVLGPDLVCPRSGTEYELIDDQLQRKANP